MSSSYPPPHQEQPGWATGQPTHMGNPGHPAPYYPQPGVAPYDAQQFAPYPQVQPRNPILYALASFLIIGLGSMLSGSVGVGITLLIAAIVTTVFMLIPFVGLLGIPVWFAIWVFAIYHGYSSAKKWNARHGIIS